jgi:queuine tRNA-ribosyltransferase
MDQGPIENDCACATCANYTRGYIHYLLKTETSLAFTLLAQHNVFFMNDLMKRIRDALHEDRFSALQASWQENPGYGVTLRVT